MLLDQSLSSGFDNQDVEIMASQFAQSQLEHLPSSDIPNPNDSIEREDTYYDPAGRISGLHEASIAIDNPSNNQSRVIDEDAEAVAA